MAEELTEKDVIRAHARDELGIDMDELSKPLAAAASSACAFVVGAGESPWIAPLDCKCFDHAEVEPPDRCMLLKPGHGPGRLHSNKYSAPTIFYPDRDEDPSH